MRDHNNERGYRSFRGFMTGNEYHLTTTHVREHEELSYIDIDLVLLGDAALSPEMALMLRDGNRR